MVVTCTAVVRGDESLTLNSAASSAKSPQRFTSSMAISESQARTSVQWLSELAVSKSPRVFTGDKNWGDTKKIWAGVKVKRDGLKLTTHRRFKELRHGRWVKYELTLPPSAAPAADSVSDSVVANVHRVRRTSDVQPGVPVDQQTGTHWEIDASVRTPIKFTARVERWNRGVQWYSIGITGKMQVRLDTSARIRFYADYSEVPPALVIAPAITQAHLELEEFEVDRVSKVGGDVAEEWGEMVETIVREIFLKKQNEKLAGKLNGSIDKHRSDLRLSMADWFTSW
ncbi:hypothetical protein K239x_44940 [Planctomycetes bacterium K23_9]|uniref:Uncharacterized protein n=2 Tax=Stieleria marina TaxID=1930275 RepID=A0A517NZC4_9BACT|nr:hypothetical protein K239x_44940 [Planctomycetes bacterium K23_9]